MDMLSEFPKYNGFPLVRTEPDTDEWLLLGYVHAVEMRMKCQEMMQEAFVERNTPVYFDKAQGSNIALDFTGLVDDTVIRIVPETPLSLVHNVFRQVPTASQRGQLFLANTVSLSFMYSTFCLIPSSAGASSFNFM